ncbi:MAG: chitooligosaccharide deacetylase, partial [Daejeonella sp.]|nr:chitooligosaccharide deacetylase [Daejeonella sp.]
MKRILFICITAIAISTFVSAQENAVWNHKKCAVALTYDDGLNVDLDNVVPVLDSMKFKGTFYVSGFSPGFKNRLTDWKKASTKGHEISNHTIYHPCTGKIAGREWVNPDYDLSIYSVK